MDEEKGWLDEVLKDVKEDSKSWPRWLRSEFWPVPSVHQEYTQRHVLHDVYEYDPTDDGPEIEIITRILASHPALDPALQARATVRLRA